MEPEVQISLPPTIETNKPDELAGFLAKFIIGYFAGPKVAAVLASIGITVDPALASIALAGLIHKIHVMVALKLKNKS